MTCSVISAKDKLLSYKSITSEPCPGERDIRELISKGLKWLREYVLSYIKMSSSRFDSLSSEVLNHVP